MKTKTAVEILDEMIIDGLVCIEQIVDSRCEDRVKMILSEHPRINLETLSSNIITINSWIQEIMRRKQNDR